MADEQNPLVWTHGSMPDHGANINDAFEEVANRSIPIYLKNMKCSPCSITAVQVCEVPRKIEVTIVFDDAEASEIKTTYNEHENFTPERCQMVVSSFWFVLGKSIGALIILRSPVNGAK